MYRDIIITVKFNLIELNQAGGVDMPFDFSKLSGKIVEKYGTQYNFAKAMGLSEHSLSTKLNNKVPWKANEIAKAVELLGIKTSKIPDYFFDKLVQKN